MWVAKTEQTVTAMRPPVQLVSPGAATAQPQNMDLRDTTRLLRRRIQLIASVTGVCTVLALLASLLMTPIYRAETVVLLEPRQTDVVDAESVVSSLTAGSEALRSEMDIIQSRAVINRVIAKLQLEGNDEFNPGGKKSLLSYLNPFSWIAPPADDEARRERTLSMVAGGISKRLHVENDGRSYSIHISFDSREPKMAALVANTFADEYLVDQLEAKYEATARANKWLSERLAEIKQQVEASERAVEEFREKNNLIDVEDGKTIAARQMEDINNQLSEARGATSQAEAKLRAAQAMVKSRNGIEGAAEVLSSPLIQNLQEKAADMRRNETELASKYGPLHPKMVNAHAQYQDLQNKIAEEVHKVILGLTNEVDIARAKETALEEQLHKHEGRAGVEMKDSVTLRQLQREAAANRTLYESFLNRFKETAQQADLQIPDSRIIARADVPVQASYPKKLLFMLVGALIGGILGVILAYLVEYFDRGFRSAAQVEQAAGIAVVGLVPDLRDVTKRAPEDYVLEKPTSSFGEALRTVRTAIHFSNVDQPPKVVMITSATPGEGKTTFCLSLARTLAKSGNRILLIDADLRRSRIGQAMGLTQVNGGLSALLAGNKGFADVVVTDPDMPNLHVIAAEGKTPNAQDLLGSHQMEMVVKEAAAQYDLVIIDTPPVLAVSDSAMVARIADTSIFIVRWAEVSQDLVLQALKQFKGFNCKIAGIVLTQVNLTEHAKYTDSYYHRNYNEYYAD